LFVEGPSEHDALNEFEHWCKTPVQIILFFFGLVNAGVTFGSVGGGTWIVLTAILIGKPLGIVSATMLSVRAGLHRPDGVTWRDLTVLGMIAGIGFTVALFFATAAFHEGHVAQSDEDGRAVQFLGGADRPVLRPFARRRTKEFIVPRGCYCGVITEETKDSGGRGGAWYIRMAIWDGPASLS
jgi:hypothetical protein